MKRKMKEPQFPVCPKCGVELVRESSDDDYYPQTWLICPQCEWESGDDTEKLLNQLIDAECYHQACYPERTDCNFIVARTLRKAMNRARRYKKAIMKYRFIAEQLEHCGKRWDKLVSMYNRDGLRLMETSRVHNASGTFGQDIEGS